MIDIKILKQELEDLDKKRTILKDKIVKEENIIMYPYFRDRYLNNYYKFFNGYNKEDNAFLYITVKEVTKGCEVMGYYFGKDNEGKIEISSYENVKYLIDSSEKITKKEYDCAYDMIFNDIDRIGQQIIMLELKNELERS